MLLIVFGVVASYCTEIFDGCILNTDGVYHVLGEVARDGAMIVGATVEVGKVLPKRFLIIILFIVFDVVSSHCTGIFDGCIFNTDGAYPVLGEVAMDGAMIVGAAVGVGKVLPKRFSIFRSFSRVVVGAAVFVIQLFVEQFVKGIAFEHTIDTFGHTILAAIGARVYSEHEVLIKTLGSQEGLDNITDKDQKQLKIFDRIFAMLALAFKPGTLTARGRAVTHTGV